MLLPMAAVELYLRGQDQDQTILPARIERGLPDADTLLRGFDRMLILTPTPGPGFQAEGLIDGSMVTVRCVGAQDDYDDAEKLAGAVDGLMVTDGNVNVGGFGTLGISRAGGPPTPVMKDSSKRTHFQCSYVIPVQSR